MNSGYMKTTRVEARILHQVGEIPWPGQEIRSEPERGGQPVLGNTTPFTCLPSGPERFLPAALAIETVKPVPCCLTNRITLLKQAQQHVIAYLIISDLYRHPFQPVILAYRTKALKGYRPEDLKQALAFLEQAGVVRKVQEWTPYRGATYQFALDLAEVYCNTGGLYYSYQEEQTESHRRTRQAFSRGISATTRKALQNLNLSWNPKTAIKVLRTLTNDQQIQAWPYIANIQGGPVKPSWYKAPTTGRLYSYRPGMQSLRKDFRRAGVISEPGADLCEVDYRAQEPNIALIMNGRKPDPELWKDMAGERAKELKQAFQGYLHSQHLGEYLHIRWKAREKKGLHYSKEAEQKDRTDFAECEAALIKKGVIRSGMTGYERKEFGKELQRRGAAIQIDFLERYQDQQRDGLVLTLHDGVIVKGKNEPEAVYDLFGEASRAILGKELPREIKPCDRG